MAALARDGLDPGWAQGSRIVDRQARVEGVALGTGQLSHPGATVMCMTNEKLEEAEEQGWRSKAMAVSMKTHEQGREAKTRPPERGGEGGPSGDREEPE